MKKYDEYKDVQMGWLNKIPIHWTTVSLKFSTGNKPLSFVDGDWIESKVIKSDGIRYLTTGNVGVISYKEQGNGFISEQTFKELNCTEVFSGDILISRLNFPIGRACIVPDLGYRIVVAVDNVIFRPDTTKYNRRYLVYQMNCYPYSENANVLGRGSTMQRITRTQLGAFKLCVPPLPEQVAIASYLDTKCAKIDNLISIQQKRIALLQELKQSVITHAVTKGLNPNVEMKPSGVEWIGDVPKHWEVCKLKHYSQVVLGKMLMTSPPKDSEGLYTLEKYLKSKNVGWLQLFLDEDNIDEMWFNQYEKSIYKLQENDIVMNEGGDIGKVSCWRGVDFDCYIQNSINKITADYNRVNAGFLCYWLYNLSSLGYFWSIVSQISIAHLTKEKLSNSPVVLPPISEQAAIASYLDHKCATIDTSISNAQHQIDLLQEYKQSLITEVVTGKRKVTDN